MTAATSSRQLAGLIGPTLVAVSVTEAVNMDIFTRQIAPFVYLNGAILFVAGLAIVRAHNRWVPNWPIIVTLVGWAALLGGLSRMAAPAAPQAGETVLTYAGLAAIALIGAILTYNGYAPRSARS